MTDGDGETGAGQAALFLYFLFRFASFFRLKKQSNDRRYLARYLVKEGAPLMILPV